MNLKRIKLTTRVEDSNEHPVRAEFEHHPSRRNVVGRVRTKGDRFLSGHRVDFFDEGEVVDVADWQAEKLIACGHAVAAPNEPLTSEGAS